MDNDADCDDEDERDDDEGAGEEGDDNDDQSHISKKSPNIKDIITMNSIFLS